MSILLPATPGIQSGKPRLLDFGGVLTPPGGGPSQRLNRLGSRFQIDVTMPTMLARTKGSVFVSRLAQAMSAGALFGFHQDIVVPPIGGPVVDLAGQAGSTLNLRSATPNVRFREGQFFSIIHGGRRYLHCVAASTSTANNGKVALPIWPLLRISPADGDVCEFAKPMIEGWLSGNSVEWAVRRDPYIDLNFTITEAA